MGSFGGYGVVDLLDLEEVLDSLLPAARLVWRVVPLAPCRRPWIRSISKDEEELSRLREIVPAGGVDYGCRRFRGFSGGFGGL